MLTPKQRELLLYINERIKNDGVSPSFDEMKAALNLASKSGIHRLITALEERGFIQRLPHRARALEVLKLPESAASHSAIRPTVFRPSLVSGNSAPGQPQGLPVIGRIAAGQPILAIENEQARVLPPDEFSDPDNFYALQVKGESMIDAGIHDGDTIVLRRTDTAETGQIVVALIDDHEATLKRLRKRGKSIALEAANPAFETQIFGPGRVSIQGLLVALVRRYD